MYNALTAIRGFETAQHRAVVNKQQSRSQFLWRTSRRVVELKNSKKYI